MKTFGKSVGKSENLDVALLIVQDTFKPEENKHPELISKLLEPYICSPVQRHEIAMTQKAFAHLDGLQISDDPDVDAGKDVDKLIGCDESIKFFTGEFRTDEHQKVMYTRFRLKQRLNKHPSKQNEVAHKKQQNRRVALRKKAIKNHFKRVTSNGLMSNKAFWDPVKPFLSNKGVLACTDIFLIKDSKIVTDDHELGENFNDYYINIVEFNWG